MPAGYSGTPLAKKLGLKEGHKVVLYNNPDHYFNLFTDLPKSFEIVGDFSSQSVDFIHLFCAWSNELKDIIIDYKIAMKKDGLLWVSWPKVNSRIQTDLNRDLIREFVLSIGLVDVKVAAIDQDWSGLKFVYRRKDRWEWNCEVSNLQKDGTWVTSNASWWFEYILGGTAIQDYWINPVNKNNANERLLGTNIRTFNPKENKWECVWLENKSKKINGIWKSHQDADKNILLYDDTGKWLITFYNITENSFDWKWDFEQPDGSMKTMSKMKAERIIYR